MAAKRGPTVRRLQLGIELRRLRERANLTMEEAVDGLGFSQPKLSRVEKGDIGLPKSADLRALLDRYGVDDPDDVDFLMELHRDSLDRGWWSTYRTFLPSGMATYIGLETDARSIQAWEPNFVLGLLQSESYARALLERAKVVEETTTEFVERNIALRMERKEQITREDSPIELWAILDEAVLRRTMGSPEVMREQYEEIRALAARDNVTVQIFPMASVSYRYGRGPFQVLDFGSHFPSMVQADDASGAVSVIDKPFEVLKYSRRLQAMRAGALAPEETSHFLEQLAGEI
ncbi:helix-turn-helix transcriptional regulator [Streptomyces sp. NPDC020719]|uniref:helix-turn-helix domain-containing protein n=1 Tax=unclassified Streptomyces TaxID=2593676 RepID=UPI0033E29151